MPKEKLSQELQDALFNILEKIEKEDEFVRLWQMREFKKHNRFWHGFQYIFWSETESDWRIPTHERLEEIGAREEVKYIYDYVVNIYKAHGESIIAALSTDLPDVRFGPIDAQDPDDLRAVKAATNTAEMIIKDNKALLLVIQALFYLCNEGFVASYRYNEKDEKYGTVQIPQYGMQDQQTTPDMANCPTCSHSEPHVTGVNDNCQQCGEKNDITKGEIEQVPVQTGIKEEPKSKEIIEVYGPLNFRMPSYVFQQKEALYGILYRDNTPEYFQDKYPDVDCTFEDATGDGEYDRIMRSSTLQEIQFQMKHLATEKNVWLRPGAYNYLGPEFIETKRALRKKFPNGIYFCFIGKEFCGFDTEKLFDDCWTITKAGPSKGVHADPLLKSLVQIQELRNNGTNYLIQMMEYGIPTDYADPEVFDFEGQQRMETSPGYVYPVKAKPGQAIEDSFYTSKTATLSRESTAIMQMLDQDAQFTSGSFPSIFGGPAQSGSKTLGEYEKSRSFALQRLSLTWYFLNIWFGETIDKAVKSFIKHQLEDEKFTVPDGSNFVTKWIRQADFKGSFSRIEPEVSSSFPMSFAQKRGVLMELAQLNNPDINSVLYDPDNAYTIKSFVGLEELKIPNEIQRAKQLREIVALIQAQPMPGIDGQMQATVNITPDIDDDMVHMEVLRNYLASDSGQDLQENNPAGFANCIAHYQEHKSHNMMQQMQQALMGMGPGLGAGPSGQPTAQPKPANPSPPKAQQAQPKVNGAAQ